MDQAAHPAKGGNHQPGGPIVELVDVYKSFGRLRVLEGVSMAFLEGRTTAVIGASAVGKSVVLKHIVGLLKPDRGDVRYRGESILRLNSKEKSELRCRFGFLFQMSALFDSLTVGENVGFPIREHSTHPPAEIERIVAQKLRMVGLDGIQKKFPAELSGGQKKRVALARAIALDPHIILYDEPTTGLDPIRADVINELILKLKNQTGATGIVVTHDMSSVRKVADRVIMLHEGKVIFDDTLAALNASDDKRVRSFVEGRASEEDLESLQTGAGSK